MTPKVKSVDASKARRMFDLWALSRDFTLTAIITSAFKTAVKGKVRMLMIMRNIRAAEVALLRELLVSPGVFHSLFKLYYRKQNFKG